MAPKSILEYDDSLIKPNIIQKDIGSDIKEVFKLPY
jgi:hypothetical protein